MKFKNTVLVILSITAFLFIFIGWTNSSASATNSQVLTSVKYVKPGATGTCSSWIDACELQSAISSAVAGDQIWVAAGTYKPTSGSDRTATFQLISGVAIYGGFVGTEASLSERDWVNNSTILSGDLNGDDEASFINYAENSYHVVTTSGVDATAIMDGFTVTGGNGNESGNFYGGGFYNASGSPTLNSLLITGNRALFGGGMSNLNGNPTLTNVTFQNNASNGQGGGGMNNLASSPILNKVTFSGNTAAIGGGMINSSSNPILINVTFNSNSATIYGGGMFNNSSSPTLTNVTFNSNGATEGGGMSNMYSSNPTLINVTFSNNTASSQGGGMYNDNSNPNLTNVTITANSAGESGGGMYNFYSSKPVVTNAIIWGNTGGQIYDLDTSSWTVINYSLLQDAYTKYAGIGNIVADPSLGPLADNGGFTMTRALFANSPAIDAGDPNICPSTDQRGFLRPIDGDAVPGARCDMGAYEYGSGLFLYLPVILR